MACNPPPPPRVVQQIEIHEVPLGIEEHCSRAGWCPHCQKVRYALLPVSIERGGLVGPRLTTLIAYLKGACHASFSTIRKFLRDVVLVTISRGQLAKIITKVSEALERPYEELLEDLPTQRISTSMRPATSRTATDVDVVPSGQLVHVVQDRPDPECGRVDRGVGQGVQWRAGLRLFLGLSSLPARVRCHAPVLSGASDPRCEVPDHTPRCGIGPMERGLREALRRLFAVIHRTEELSAECFQSQLEVARAEVLRCGTEGVPETRPSRNLAKRLEAHGESYFRFLTTPGVEPTNNLAEQAIRFVVLDRLVTQGTRSEAGNRWCERIWTVIATCSQQGRSVFAFLEAAVAAWFAGPNRRLLPESERAKRPASAQMQGLLGPGSPEGVRRRR